MINYEGIKPRVEIDIDKIFSLHYFEFPSDYSFIGESHNFWELVFVDSGEIFAVSDKNRYLIKSPYAIFHKPNEYHNLIGTKKTPSNVFIISFSTKSSSMRFFENRIVAFNNNQKNIIAQILNEYKNAFVSPLDMPILSKLERNRNQEFATEQLIEINLKRLLISIIRKYKKNEIKPEKNNTITTHEKNTLFNLIENYLDKNINKNLTQSQIANDFGLSISMLKRIYSNRIDYGVIEHFTKKRINKAKELIRMGNKNISEISDFLGYSTIQHFSRQFKKITKKSPTEYSKTADSMKDFDF